MSKLEKQEENTIKKWCEANGVLFIKFTPFGSKGWPDRIAVFPGGFHVWTELKRKGEVPRKLQNYRMAELQSMGVVTMWFDNATTCIDFYQDCLDAANDVGDKVIDSAEASVAAPDSYARRTAPDGQHFDPDDE